MNSPNQKQSPSRRDLIAALSVAGATLATSWSAAAATTAPKRAPAPGPKKGAAKALTGTQAVLPLPFKPGALNGISERMIVSHHDNNYAGAVKSLNKVELELSQIKSDTPPYVVAGLHQSELTFRNSKTLHEAYFGNLGGNGKRGGPIEKALSEAYGTSARWEEHFRATGNSLGGGSGWAILGLELLTGELRTTWSGHHTQALSTAVPLLVLDMYEHAYQMDFGAAAARYIDAYFANVNWDAVNQRLEHGIAAGRALRG